jgi:hypothetical protein
MGELLKAVSATGGAHGAEPVRQKRPDFRAIKAKHPQAYRSWTPEEDAQLRAEVGAQLPVSAIARNHGRQPGAIRSRISKLLADRPAPE